MKGHIFSHGFQLLLFFGWLTRKSLVCGVVREAIACAVSPSGEYPARAVHFFLRRLHVLWSLFDTVPCEFASF